MVWGIFDFRDSTWMMAELGKRGWTRKPSEATPFVSWSDADTSISKLASQAHTPRIKPRLLPTGDTQQR
jgi:hypothetical protein